MNKGFVRLGKPPWLRWLIWLGKRPPCWFGIHITGNYWEKKFGDVIGTDCQGCGAFIYKKKDRT